MSNYYKEGAPSFWLLFRVFCGFSVYYAIFFSPILFGGREFISDGQLAAFYSKLTLWSDEWAGGWPAAADLTQMMFSPLRNLFRHLHHGFNLFVVASYVLSSTFMFGYVYGITRSRLAGIVSGLVMGLNGFMMGHLGNTGIISGVAWFPLLLWALDRLRYGYKPLWLGFGALSVCIMILAGHPQITVYSCLIGGAYALVFGFEAKQGSWRYWLAITSMFAMGVGLSAFQWLPAYELSKETLRTAYTFEDFTALSLPIEQVLMLIFPFLYGSEYGLFFGESYFGAWHYPELSGYAGLFSITLATVALVARRDRLSIFWILVALMAVMLSLGSSLPWLAKLTYHMPVLNRFRVPARHIYEYGLAMSVLAGLGVAALQQGTIGGNNLLRMTRLVAVFFITLIMVAVLVYSKTAPENYSQGAFHFFSFRLSPAIYVPILWMMFATLILFLYVKNKLGAKKEWLMLLIVTFDMGSFGWFHDWRFFDFNEPPVPWHVLKKYANLANNSQQKLIGQNIKTIPDSGRIFGIHSLNWYGPLLLKRYSEITGIDTSGTLDPNALAESNVGLDIFGGRYLLIGTSRTIQLKGIPWDRQLLGLNIGHGCGSKQANKHQINIPAPFAANGLEMVTQLSCSSNFKDGEPVANVILHGVDGQKETIILRAGIDTAEWAADCQDVIPMMHHRAATIFESVKVLRQGDQECDGHTYLAHTSFASTRVAAIEINVRDNVTLSVQRMTLSDTKTDSTHAINPVEGRLMSKRWRFLQATDGVSVYENTRAMSPVWLAFEAITVSPEQALKAIHTLFLPDGRKFDPARQVLVEKDIAINGVNGKGKANVVRHDDTNWEINTQSNGPGLLVIGQNYYPGWQATLDGQPIDLIRVNYSQQGLLLPTGEHKVELAFRSVTFMWGLVISGISLTVLLYLFWRRRHSRIVPMEVQSK